MRNFRFFQPTLACLIILSVSGCLPGTTFRCTSFSDDCALVEADSDVYLDAGNFDPESVFIKAGTTKELSVWLVGSDTSDDIYTLDFDVSKDGYSVAGISFVSFFDLKKGRSSSLSISVAEDVEPGVYDGKIFALKSGIYAVLDITIVVLN
jgi:hypothetical protein